MLKKTLTGWIIIFRWIKYALLKASCSVQTWKVKQDQIFSSNRVFPFSMNSYNLRVFICWTFIIFCIAHQLNYSHDLQEHCTDHRYRRSGWGLPRRTATREWCIVHGIKRQSSSFKIGSIDHLYQDPHIDHCNFVLHQGIRPMPPTWFGLCRKYSPASFTI